jgi:acetylornithine deacetylase/succinyl-diaminopimelate desuccinylase-like protein
MTGNPHTDGIAAALAPEEWNLFRDFLRFPSINARPEHAGDVRACAEWLDDLLRGWGLESRLCETAGAPVVLARTAPVANARTVLLYGHYDVQPVEPLELWHSAPFEPEVRDGFVYARGATDNKGQTFSHLLGLRRLLQGGPLPINLILVLEGEEEIGSPHFGEFLRAHRDELACDAALVSDTSMIAPGEPALTLGLRGIACFEVTLRGPAADLHSGMFGGATPNPALALSRILGRLHDADGRIAIPGFYDDVLPVATAERESWEKLPWQEEWFVRTTGVRADAGEDGLSVLERVWARPTAEVNGLASGHQGAGSKTIIPATATAKLSFRLAPAQVPDRVAELVAGWFRAQFDIEQLPGEIRHDHGGEPFYTPPDDPFLQAAAAALAEVFGRPPALTREGLSIPATAMLQKELGMPVVLAGLGLPDCNAHAPDECYPLAHLDLGARLFAAMVRRFAAVR